MCGNEGSCLPRLQLENATQKTSRKGATHPSGSSPCSAFLLAAQQGWASTRSAELWTVVLPHVATAGGSRQSVPAAIHAARMGVGAALGHKAAHPGCWDLERGPGSAWPVPQKRRAVSCCCCSPRLPPAEAGWDGGHSPGHGEREPVPRFLRGPEECREGRGCSELWGGIAVPRLVASFEMPF